MSGQITQLLAAVQGGDSTAESQLAELVYGELHGMAARYTRGERSDHSLQPTVLVHEAYVRLVKQEDRNWANRSHFFAVAARLMRQILIDHARGRNAAKRGGPQVKLPLGEIDAFVVERLDEVLAVDRASTVPAYSSSGNSC